MKVVVVGATGTIGSAIVEELERRHDVVRVGNTRGQINVDLASHESIEALFAQVGPFDALVSAAGEAKFAPLEKLTNDDFLLGFSNKLLGQINLVRLGMLTARDGGSFTLTSGVLASEPMPGSSAISPVNAGVEGFVRASALELTRGMRINVVSPPWVSETLTAMGMDPSGGMPAKRLATVYAGCLEGKQNGQVIDARKAAR
ncbi:MAG TPA: short chain dehydrogenase [Thermoanaerobaculia bacterium]|nr:short chain dehydrogenase [Thermoanaerobaculia bacterium]